MMMQPGEFHVLSCVTLTAGHLILFNGKMNMTHEAILCPQGKYKCKVSPNSDNSTAYNNTDFCILSGICLQLPISANLHLLISWLHSCASRLLCVWGEQRWGRQCSVLYSGRTPWYYPYVTIRPHPISRLKPLEAHWRIKVTLCVFLPLCVAYYG